MENCLKKNSLVILAFLAGTLQLADNDAVEEVVASGVLVEVGLEDDAVEGYSVVVYTEVNYVDFSQMSPKTKCRSSFLLEYFIAMLTFTRVTIFGS